MTSIEQVKEFHEVFGITIGKKDEPALLKDRQLRVKLIFEELEEYAAASDVMGTFAALCLTATNSQEKLDAEDGDNVDKKEQVDALCDLRYVVDGSAVTDGVADIYEENIAIVHRNNMTKAHQSRAHCLETIRVKQRKGGLGEETYTIVDKQGKFLLFDINMKLVKPHDHQKVKLRL